MSRWKKCRIKKSTKSTKKMKKSKNTFYTIPGMLDYKYIMETEILEIL